MRFRGRPFRRSEAVPGTASIGILIPISWSVKCLMSYIRVKRGSSGNPGCREWLRFSCEIRRPGREPCRAWCSGSFGRPYAGAKTICGHLPGRDSGRSTGVRPTVPGLNFGMWNPGASRSKRPPGEGIAKNDAFATTIRRCFKVPRRGLRQESTSQTPVAAPRSIRSARGERGRSFC